jgi:hypothetical protein
MIRSCTARPMSADREEICLAVSSGNGAMPSVRWHPAHFSAIIGATSRVKLGVPPDIARAAIGIVTAGIDASPAAIQECLRMRVMCAPQLAEHAADLTDRAARA